MKHRRVTFDMPEKMHKDLIALAIAQKYGVSAALRDAVVDLILKHRSKQTTNKGQP